MTKCWMNEKLEELVKKAYIKDVEYNYNFNAKKFYDYYYLSI